MSHRSELVIRIALLVVVAATLFAVLVGTPDLEATPTGGVPPTTTTCCSGRCS